MRENSPGREEKEENYSRKSNSASEPSSEGAEKEAG